jgi:hypothetical protein
MQSTLLPFTINIRPSSSIILVNVQSMIVEVIIHLKVRLFHQEKWIICVTTSPIDSVDDASDMFLSK